MGRFYTISKAIEAEQEAQILSELNAKEQVEKAEIAEDNDGKRGLFVYADSDAYTEIMAYAVNVFSREGSGATLSFDHFVVE